MKTKFTLVMALIAAFTKMANAQWANVASSSVRNLYTVSFSGSNAIIGGANGTIIYSSDAGLTWNDSLYYPYDPVFASGYGSATSAVMGSYKLFVSSNSGSTFAGPYTVSGFGDFHDIAMVAGGNGIAVDNNCNVALSTDEGQNWTLGPHPCGGVPEMSDLDFPTATTGYLCGANGNVFKTTNGGSTWAPVAAPAASNVSYRCLSFTDANTGFITGKTNAGQDTVVFKKTTDGGATWVDMKGPLFAAGVKPLQVINSFCFASASTGYLVSENKIFKTTNGGTSWSLDFTSTTGGGGFFNKIVATPALAFAVGENGMLARLAGGSTGISETKAINEISVYPNPANNSITLGGFLVQNQNAFLQITDVTGRIVKAERVTTNLVDIADFGTGLYFGKLSGNTGNTYSFKFLKQ